MYHSRTKKVATYGKRGRRVVAVSADGRLGSDSPSAPCSDRSTSEAASRPAHKRKIVTDMSALPSQKSSLSKSNAMQGSKATCTEKKPVGKFPAKSAPVRKPLGSYRPNIPNSSTVSPKIHNPRIGPGKNSPRKRKVSTITPYVDVGIVVLDEDRRRLSEEHRVAKINVPVNAVDGAQGKHLRRSRRETSAKKPIVIESEEGGVDDDDEYIPALPTRKKVTDDAKPSASKHIPTTTKKHREKECTPITTLSLGDSDFEAPRRAKSSKHAIRTVVISDSDSDSLQIPKSLLKHDGSGQDSTRLDTLSLKTVAKARDASTRRLDRSTHDHGVFAPRDGAAKNRRRPSRLSQARPMQQQKHSVDFNLTLDSGAKELATSQSHLRQLTPIKQPRLQSAFLQQKPAIFSPSRLVVLSDDEKSFSMDEELQLALQVAEIQLAPSSGRPSKQHSVGAVTDGPSGARTRTTCSTISVSRNGPHKLETPSSLRPLLPECGQLALFDFPSFIETFPADPIIATSNYTSTASDFAKSAPFTSYRKVGEASYSEVFGIGNVVLKIVPLFHEKNDVSATWSADWDPPPVSEPQDVLKEIIVTRTMGEICKGFIKLLKVHLVQGPYPDLLLKLWDEYAAARGSESIRPDHFTSMQTYAIIILPNGGTDLENFSFASFREAGGSGWRQACSIFWQVVRSLASSEDVMQFEHRDLHWGQILVRNTMKTSRFLFSRPLSEKVPLDDPSHGVQSTIIDLGLARINYGQGETFWTPFSKEIFEGEGDYQYDVYRMMRKHNEDEWQSFRPLTNVMWLHYLADKLIYCKRLRLPDRGFPRSPKRASGDAIFEADKRAYESLMEIEPVLRQSIDAIARSTKAKARPRKQTKTRHFELERRLTHRVVGSASDVLGLGKERGWIE